MALLCALSLCIAAKDLPSQPNLPGHGHITDVHIACLLFYQFGYLSINFHSGAEGPPPSVSEAAAEAGKSNSISEVQKAIQ
eukprot:scaffold9750_cov21-Tisochrysis_lutea.AAC.1